MLNPTAIWKSSSPVSSLSQLGKRLPGKAVVRGGSHPRHFSSIGAGVIGFIGLGQMGSRMAINLVTKSQQRVVVYDVNQEAVEALKRKGASAATSVEQVASEADTVVTMLPATSHVVQVMEGSLFKKAKRGSLLIDSSTISPPVSKELIAKASAAQLRMVDAPVSGGVGGAEAGTLTFMVGGLGDDVEAAKGVLNHMGSKVVHCGGPGMGSVAKVCNNLVLGINMAGTAEAMLLGQRLGIDPQVLCQVINTSSGRSWVTDVYAPVPGIMPHVPSSRGYQGGFASALMAKDLSLAHEAAKSVSSPLPMGALAHQLYALLSAHGYAHKDFAAIFEFLAGGGEG